MKLPRSTQNKAETERNVSIAKTSHSNFIPTNAPAPSKTEYSRQGSGQPSLLSEKTQCSGRATSAVLPTGTLFLADGKTQAEEGSGNPSAGDAGMLRSAAAASSDLSLLITLQGHLIR